MAGARGGRRVSGAARARPSVRPSVRRGPSPTPLPRRRRTSLTRLASTHTGPSWGECEITCCPPSATHVERARATAAAVPIGRGLGRRSAGRRLAAGTSTSVSFPAFLFRPPVRVIPGRDPPDRRGVLAPPLAPCGLVRDYASCYLSGVRPAGVARSFASDSVCCEPCQARSTHLSLSLRRRLHPSIDMDVDACCCCHQSIRHQSIRRPVAGAVQTGQVDPRLPPGHHHRGTVPLPDQKASRVQIACGSEQKAPDGSPSVSLERESGQNSSNGSRWFNAPGTVVVYWCDANLHRAHRAFACASAGRPVFDFEGAT